MSRKPATSAKTHGLHALMRRVNARGVDALDGRTTAVKAVTAWRKAIVADLGGEGNVSSAKLALVESAVRTRLLLDHVDAYILGLPSIVDKRRRRLLPVIAEREALSASLTALLSKIGLERAAKPAPSLESYLRSKSAEKASPAPKELQESQREEIAR